MSAMLVPMLDPKRSYAALREQLDSRLLDVAASGHYVLGPNVAAFEQEVAAYVGSRRAVAVASGTDALHLALKAAGVGAGDEVITTPFTFAATVEAIDYVGATAVLADIDAGTFNIDPEQVEAAITPRTKALLPVHLFGLPAAMDELMVLAERHGLEVIEDCAQSLGARAGDRCVGRIGTAGALSFYPSKTLGGFGDGGMITTNSDELAERILKLRNHGQSGSYEHAMIGFNSRLDEIQAAILRVKLPLLDGNNARRRQIAAHYNEALSATAATTPAAVGDTGHVYGYYTIRTPNRDAVRDALRRRGVATAIYYPKPMHQHEGLRRSCRHGALPIAEQAAQECLSLPVFPELTDAEVEYVASTTSQVIDAA